MYPTDSNTRSALAISRATEIEFAFANTVDNKVFVVLNRVTLIYNIATNTNWALEMFAEL